jgi:hypothetical protein
MLCTFCNSARLNNGAPCPQCGAPAPLASRMNGTVGAGTEVGAGFPPTAPWEGSTASLASIQVGQQYPPVFPQTPQVPSGQQQQPVSMLPVPYQHPQPFNVQQTGSLMGSGLIPIPMQHLGAMIPAPPADESIIHVPPMYTKPRAIIPRYRALSGLLSILIVGLIFCSGAGYYAKASGKLSALGQFYGAVLPANVKPAPPKQLPNPPATVFGPAYSIINSATTNSRIDPISHASAQSANVFQVNQAIYLTYSVQRPKSPGIVTIKWYTNGTFYQSPQPIHIDKDAINGYEVQKYVQPEEGSVELYWNNQLAIRLYFVVR